MTVEETKAERERFVFRTFIEKSGLQIRLESVESRKPPEPDILCFQDNEGKIAFELVEICDETLARKISETDNEEFGYVRCSDPSRAVLRKKLKRSYQTEHPIELLCYAGRTISADSTILAGIRPMISGSNGQFRRIWLLGDRHHLVWPIV
jgi:hypothetical protein